MIVSNRLAAVLSGRSLAAYMQHVAPYCRAAGGGCDLGELEAYLGVHFEPAALWAAHRRLDGLRARERQYKRTVA